jgi:hypothetical protein
MSSVRNLLALLAVAALAGCGGGGSSDSSGGTGGTGVSIGVMTVGSVIVNGVEYDDTTASITIDDAARNRLQLRDGMVVKVRGRRNVEGVTGTAERVEVENEVRGTVQSTSPGALPPSFVVVGQTVLVDDLTVFANFDPAPTTPPSQAVAALTLTTVVEVHGQRDGAGNIRASRVEIKAPDVNIDELRGTIKAGTLDVVASTFTLKNGITDVAVNYNGATISPAGATLTEDALVEIHGNFNAGVFAATRVDLEDLEDDEFEPADNQDLEVEGFVAGCPDTGCGNTFTVNGRSVRISSNTRFRDGTRADLFNGVKVEAEGQVIAGVLEATKISFRRTQIRLFGTVTATGTNTITVLDKPVQLNDLTRVATIGGSFAVNDRVEIRGFVDQFGTIVAESAEEKSGGGDDFIQAPVEEENPTAQTLVVLGITANLTGTPDNRIFGADDQPLAGGKAAFFDAVVPATATSPGTLVKVKGNYNTNTLAVTEAELED